MLAVTLTIASLALAQADTQTKKDEPARPKEDVASGLQTEGVRKAKYDEVERGLSFRVPVGVFTYLTPVKNVASGQQLNYDPGIMMGVEVSYDLARFIDLGGFFYYAQTPERQNGIATYDLNTFFGGALVRVSFYTSERLFIGLRLGVGYGTQDNLVQRRQQGVVATAAPTIEYYTKLRHISLALDVGAVVWTAPIAVGLSVLPAVRYTF
jgi:hypothetical protein